MPQMPIISAYIVIVISNHYGIWIGFGKILEILNVSKLYYFSKHYIRLILTEHKIEYNTQKTKKLVEIDICGTGINFFDEKAEAKDEQYGLVIRFR